MTLMLVLALGCTKTKDATPEDTQVEDTQPAVELGTITGRVVWPGTGLTEQSKLHISMKVDSWDIWQDSDYREEHANPTLPFDYSIQAPAGTYNIGAFVDLTADTPGGPGPGDPEGLSRDDNGPYLITVIVGETSEAPPISLKVKDQDGQ